MADGGGTETRDYRTDPYGLPHSMQWQVVNRVAPLAEHAPQTRNPLLPRDFTLPHVTDEDC